jgi:rhamnosyltransferase
MHIAIAVILYRPEAGFLDRIAGYSGFCDSVVIIDNTSGADLSPLFARLSSVFYLPMGENLGISRALNIAARIAIENGSDWMISLDQDSNMTQRTYESLRQEIVTAGDSGIAIIAPVQVSVGVSPNALYVPGQILDVVHTMTSGSALQLKTYLLCGGFEEKLFIDHVDTEYCLRLRQRGFRVVQVKGLFMDHSLGAPSYYGWFGLRFVMVGHKPFRSYYYTRNGFFVAFRYFRICPRFFFSFLLQLSKQLAKALFVQEEKRLRLRMFALGFWHFLSGRYGRLES